MSVKTKLLSIGALLLFGMIEVSGQTIQRTGGTIPTEYVCTGSLTGVGYSVNTGTITGITGYFWTVDGGSISGSHTGSNVTINWTTGGRLAVQIFQNNQTNPSFSDDVTVSIVGAPSITITGPATVCFHQTADNFDFTSSITNGIGTITDIKWYRNGVQIPNQSNWTLSTTLSNGDQISMKVWSSGWCGSSPITSNTYTTSVTSSVTPTVTITRSATEACTGQTVTFTASSSYAGGSPTYSWSMGGVTPVSTASTFSPSVHTDNGVPFAYSPNDQVSVTMAGLTNGACLTSSNATTIAPSVTINPPPTPPTGFSDVARCGPGAVTLSATVGSYADKLKWYTGGGAYTLLTGDYTTPSLSSTTSYSVASYNSNSGCESSVSTRSAIINPIPDLPSPSGPNSRCGDGVVTLNASYGTNGSEVKWYAEDGNVFPGTVVSGTQAQTPSISTSTTYSMSSLNSQTGCESSRTPIVATVNAIPSAPSALSATSRYGIGTVTLAGTTSSNTLAWYTQSDGGAAFSTGTTNVTSPSISTTTTFYAASRNTTSLCESQRVAVDGVVKTLNAVITQTVQIAGKQTETDVNILDVGDVLQNAAYVDGLGRGVQSVDKKASPGLQDINTPVVYDNVGRESVKYLPFAAEQSGIYKPHENIFATDGSYAGIAASFYSTSTDDVADDTKPYAVTVYEASPLNRVLKQGAPGNAWQPNASSPDRTVKKQYTVNDASEVYLFSYDPATGTVGVQSGAAKYYDAGQLQVTITTDEHQNDVIEYVDQLGHTVCKKVQYKITGNVKEYACTYYLYDDFDNLVTVLPPEAVRVIESHMN